MISTSSKSQRVFYQIINSYYRRRNLYEICNHFADSVCVGGGGCTHASAHVYRTSLNLDDFDTIKTLDQLRDFIPTIGANIKTFAASRNNRYLDPFSMRFTLPPSFGSPGGLGVYVEPASF